MASRAALGTRRSTVLRAVVRQYIRTAEPVGSAAIVSRYHIRVSPATVRNDMAVLEDLGYLAQPHTSAGRIPTDTGYRFYVDALPRRTELPSAHARAVRAFPEEPTTDIEELLRGAALLLSRLTHYAGVSAGRHVFLGGAANIAREEAFERRETVQRVFEVLDDEEAVLDYLNELPLDRGDITIRIGKENRLSAMREASLVTAPYEFVGRSMGAVAVIGPTRMQYPSAIAAVGAVARRLSEVMRPLVG
jgi:transcriptional regulator of heat shock response